MAREFKAQRSQRDRKADRKRADHRHYRDDCHVLILGSTRVRLQFVSECPHQIHGAVCGLYTPARHQFTHRLHAWSCKRLGELADPETLRVWKTDPSDHVRLGNSQDVAAAWLCSVREPDPRIEEVPNLRHGHTANAFGDRAVFESRAPTGAVWRGEPTEDDLIITRILTLEGLEDSVNRGPGCDSLGRYIYIHGTNHLAELGRPASHGCVRLSSEDIAELFERVKEGDAVVIVEGEPGAAP